jgi:HD-like signal output (HDOD) protein
MAAMSNPQHQLAQLKSLPALPATVTRLVSALNNDELDMRELVDIVKRDEALTVAVLRLANSSVYGGAQDESFDLNQSITRIGFKKLREIALAHKTSKLLERPVEGYGLDRGQLWEGAIAGAVSAEIVAQKTQLIEPEMAFVAGLLRDIGKLAMDTIYTSEILRIQFEKRNERQSQLSLEQEIFGMDHAELGYELAKLWELPERLCVAIRYHHGVPDEETDSDPLWEVVHAGDMLAIWMGRGLGYDGMAYELNEKASQALQLKVSVLEELLAEAQWNTKRYLEVG